jgi:CHAT domain-containing protein
VAEQGHLTSGRYPHRIKVCFGAAPWLVLAAFAVSSASVAAPCSISLADALTTHVGQAQKLRQARGLQRREEAYSVEDVENYARHTSSTFLIYVEESIEFCVYRVTPAGSIESVRLQVPGAIEQSLERLQRSLGVESSQLDRAPVKRGLQRMPAAAAAVKKIEKIDVAAAEVADAVIPVPWQWEMAATAHLIVLPAAIVGVVPFSILPVGRARRALVETTEVAVLPAFNEGPHARELGNPAGDVRLGWQLSTQERSLVVGNPAFPDNDPEWIWPSLPGAELEAKEAGRRLPGSTTLIGRAATVAEVSHQLEDANYLYFATHGVADPVDPLDGSFLMLSDGRVTARQVQARSLQASVVVLSACQTGLGQQHEAGMIGLSRAFQIAGVPSVVMSLWSVDDAATAELMRHFLEYLSENPPDRALHRAMLSTRQTFPKPSQWGAFAYFGWPLSNRMEPRQ